MTKDICFSNEFFDVSGVESVVEGTGLSTCQWYDYVQVGGGRYE